MRVELVEALAVKVAPPKRVPTFAEAEPETARLEPSSDSTTSWPWPLSEA
ncbi:MAG: hypothetical protein ACK56F_12945 [bacterium]